MKIISSYVIYSVALLLTSVSIIQAQQYIALLRWVSDDTCTAPPDQVRYWPEGSAFIADFESAGVSVGDECVQRTTNGRTSYYTAINTDSIQTYYSTFFAQETYYTNSSECPSGEPQTIIQTNSDSCIHYGASTTGYTYLRLACDSETTGVVLSCRDDKCTDCRAPYSFPGGCGDFVNSVHACAAGNPIPPPLPSAVTPAPTLAAIPPTAAPVPPTEAHAPPTEAPIPPTTPAETSAPTDTPLPPATQATTAPTTPPTSMSAVSSPAPTDFVQDSSASRITAFTAVSLLLLRLLL